MSVGKPITKIIAKMADVNTNNMPATGNIVAKIVKASDGTIPTGGISNNVDAATVTNNQGGTSTSAWSNHTFTFTGLSYPMATGDKVQFEYDQNGVPPEGITLYAQLATTPVSGIFSNINAQYLGGQRFLTGNDVIGKVITKVIAKLCDLNPTGNAATGNVVAKIITAGNTLKSTSDNIDASTLADNANGTSTTAWTQKTFTFTGNAWPMATGDRVQFEYDQGGTVGGTGEALSGYNLLNNSEVQIGSCDWDSTPLENMDNTSSVLHGKIVTKVVCMMSDMNNGGTPASGTVICRIRRGDTNAVVASSNTFNATSIADYPSKTPVTFTFASNTWVMSGSRTDFINFETSNYGGASSNMTVGVVLCNDAEANMIMYGNGGAQAYPQYDIAMDVYVQSAGTYKQVGVAAVTTDPETNSNVYDAQWSAPTTLTQQSSADMLMDVYAGSTALAKAIGIAYSTTAAQANSNAYDAPWSTGTVADKSTFDLGIDVYIDTKTGTPNHQYTPLQNAGNKFAALYISSGSAGLVAKQPTKFTFRINKVGAPTGSIFCRIKKGSDGTTITFPLTQPVSAASIDVSTLTTAAAPATLYTFELRQQRAGRWLCSSIRRSSHARVERRHIKRFGIRAGSKNGDGKQDRQCRDASLHSRNDLGCFRCQWRQRRRCHRSRICGWLYPSPDLSLPYSGLRQYAHNAKGNIDNGVSR